MPGSDQLSTRSGVGLLAVRWLLIGVVLSGVVAMHILSEPAAGGGHGVLMDVKAGQITSMHDQDSASMGAMAGAPAVMAMPDGSMGSMAACCILFLVVGAVAALLTMLFSVRARAAVVLRPLSSGLLNISPRGRPGRRPPRIFLCVQRV